MTNSMMRGLSIGIVIATTLLSFVFYTSTKEEERTITAEEVELYLEKNDLITMSKKEYEQLQLVKKEENSPKQEEEEEEEEEEEQDKKEATKENTDDESKEEEPVSISYTLSIVSGMNSQEIATLLENQNIVPSGKEFNDFLTENNLNTAIQIGTYELTSDMSFQTIADIITK